MKTRSLGMLTKCLAGLLAINSSGHAQQLEIQDGTKVSCRLEQTISSATAEQGQQVQLSVTEDVKLNGTIVIPQGSTVIGTIVLAEEKRRMGRTGKLDFSIDKVRAVDGEYISLHYTLTKKEGGSHAVSTGVMTAGAAVLFWPAAPFFLLRKGKDVVINKGIVLEAFTDSKHVLKSVSPSTSTAAAPAASPASGSATLTITSSIAGADIEIDGAYIGSTPSTQTVTAGLHKIVVKSGGKVWERNLQVGASGAVNVNANFDK